MVGKGCGAGHGQKEDKESLHPERNI